MLDMNPEIRARWTALRSGDYPQGHNALCDTCPKPSWNGPDSTTATPLVRVHVDGLSKAGLADLNDDEKWTFAQIADAIDGGASLAAKAGAL